MGQEYIRQIMVLGSVPTLGPVLMFDDIEDLLKWSKSGTGADYTIEKDATVAYNGNYSLHMKTRVTNPAAADQVKAQRLIFQAPGKRYRIEALFRVKTLADLAYLSLFMIVQDGVTQHKIEIRYKYVTTAWQYYSSVGVWTDIPGGSQGFYDGSWHRFKIEVDEYAKKFIKFTCDSLEVDMSAIPYWSQALAGSTWIEFDLQLEAAGATPPEGYFDDVLVMEI